MTTNEKNGEGAKVEQSVKRYKVPDDYVGVIRHKGYGHVEVVTAADHDAAIADLLSRLVACGTTLAAKDAKLNAACDEVERLRTYINGRAAENLRVIEALTSASQRAERAEAELAEAERLVQTWKQECER